MSSSASSRAARLRGPGRPRNRRAIALAAALGTLVVFLGSQQGGNNPGSSGPRVSVPAADAATETRPPGPSSKAADRERVAAMPPDEKPVSVAAVPPSALPALLFDPSSLIAAEPGPRVAVPDMALRSDTLPPAEPPASERASRPLAGEAVTSALPAPGPVPDEAPRARAAAPRLAGTWAVDRAGCARRGAAIPMVITEKGARAGGASCRFARTQQAGNRWTIAAACRSGQESWTANVRLVLEGSQLTWTSERGTERYQRCR